MSEKTDFPSFDLQKDHWIFSSYYKYRFTFQSLEHPTWFMSYGGDSDQIYRYGVGATAVSFDEATEGAYESIESVLAGKDEYVYVWEHNPNG